MNSQSLRLIALLLFMPAALLPTEVDLCLTCLFGDSVVTASCCSPVEEAPVPACCCAPKTATTEATETEKVPCGAESSCCIHIDNERDEVPAPAYIFELPALPEVLTATTAKVECLNVAPSRPVLALDRSPPPEAPLALLI